MKPALKYPGAKWNIAKWIISHFPPHTTYLEPFFGSGAVFFNKPPSKVETINDIDGNVVNLFRVIREKPEELAALIEMTPWAREEYYSSFEKSGDSVEDARRFLVRTWQAFASDTSKKTGWRHERQGQQGRNAVKIWESLSDRAIVAAKRLKYAQIEQRDAIELIKSYCFDTVLIYADPPYLRETRTNTLYSNEMTNEQHQELLVALNAHLGTVLLSGYDCELYSGLLENWHKATKRTTAEMGRTREEILWINPAGGKYLQKTIFD